uniref:Uncharacterized protein n=1 Tax=Arundo donax TaxID=35708 RepID=A0A0A8ZEM3_ARUDO
MKSKTTRTRDKESTEPYRSCILELNRTGANKISAHTNTQAENHSNITNNQGNERILE